MNVDEIIFKLRQVEDKSLPLFFGDEEVTGFELVEFSPEDKEFAGGTLKSRIYFTTD